MPAGGAAYAQPQQQAPMAPYPQPHPQAAYPYPPPGYPPYPPPPGYPPYPQAPGAPAPTAEQQPVAVAPEPEPEPELASDPEPDPMAALMDDAPDPARDEDPMAAFDTGDDGDDDEALSQDDLEALFDEDEDDTAPFESIIEDGDEDDDGTAFDDLEDPDPIPEVFTAGETGDDEDTEYDDDYDEDDDEDESSGSMLKIIIAVVVLVLILGSIGAAVFLRNTIIDTFPSAEGFYSMVGLEDDSLGGGLSINDVKSTRESIGGKDVLVVRGDVVNVSERPRPVPMLELRLSDTDGKVVQSAKSAPLKNELIAGDKIAFEIQLENPSALARRLEVTFIEREAPGS